MQVDTWERGFSYAYDAPLDMRMGPERSSPRARSSTSGTSAGWRGCSASTARSATPARIARGIVRARDREELFSTQQLVEVIKAAVPVPAQFAGGHPARRTFQALRIAVNDELFQLDAALPAVWNVLRAGGRFAAISFHSLEDRRVKRFLADRARGCVCPPELPVCVCGHHPEAELLTDADRHRLRARSKPTRGRSRPISVPLASSRATGNEAGARRGLQPAPAGP